MVYNPGLLQTVLVNVPVSIFALRTLWQEHYRHRSFFEFLPVLLFLMALNALPMLLVNGSEPALTVAYSVAFPVTIGVGRALCMSGLLVPSHLDSEITKE